MAEATLYKDADTIDVTTPSAGYSSGEVIQIADGRAAVVMGLAPKTSGDAAALKTSGQFMLVKGADLEVLEGAPLYWDRSAGSLTPLKAVAGGDFYVGVALADVAAATLTCAVDLNVAPNYTIDIMRDPADSVATGNATLTMHPGYLKFLFTSTSEIQKIDLLSMSSVPVDPDGDVIPFIVEGRMAIQLVGSAATVDMNIGLADATHGTDAGAIDESVFLHFNNALDIFAESDDGTTEVSETNTTVDAVDDTYFDFAFDCRDLTDIKIYIDGVRVLDSSTFVLNKSGIGPIKLLVHLEKETGTAVGELRVSKLALRCTDLAT